MAWRDGRAGVQRLVLSMASIVLGVAAVVAIQSFGENMDHNIADRSKALMGADYRISSNRPATPEVEALMDSLGGPSGREISFPSMVRFEAPDAVRLMEVRGIGGGFPFHGKLETLPATAAETYDEEGGALVDATIMLQYRLAVGDTIAIGNIKLPILGSLESAPGGRGLSATIAPPVIIPYRFVVETGLIQVGSRLEYDYYFVAGKGEDVEVLPKLLNPRLNEEDARITTHFSAGRQLGRRYDNLERFLNLSAYIALLLGCVGIASSVQLYLKDKRGSIAVLKCLGTSRLQAFSIYLSQIAFMGLLGGILGSGIGLVIQRALPGILGDFVKMDIDMQIYWQPAVLGILVGLVMSVLFALVPLFETWYVSPLQALRADGAKVSKPFIVRYGIPVLIALAVVGFSSWLLGQIRLAVVFTLAILAVYGLLAGIAYGFMRIVKRYFPDSWGYVPRQSLLNLFRPNNQTLVLLLAIGTGTFLIGTLYFTRDFLLARSDQDTGNAPNLILMDVQTAETDVVSAMIRKEGHPVLEEIPIVTMRVQKIKGIPVATIRKDTASKVNTWILNHEFRTTYRDSLIGSEEVIAGEFTGVVPKPGSVVPISLAENVAQGAGVTVGDTLEFNIQGMPMTTVVGSIRKVDWGRLQVNFSLLFPSGVLENAPKFHVLATRVPDEKSSAALQAQIVDRFPTISILDLRQVLTVAREILDQISWVVNFMAFFSIFTGLIVLIGSIRTSRYQRISESVLLRTMGAQGRQILGITALEYLFLALLGAIPGMFLALVASQLLALYTFQTAFIPTWIPFTVIIPLIVLLVIVIGMLNSRGVLKSPPLEVLRKEVG